MSRSQIWKIVFGPKGAQVFIILASIPLIYLFGFREMRFFMVPSASMVPTLLRGDYIVTLNENKYHRGEIVVLDDPTEPGAFIVKRIVGTEGDTVSVGGGALFVNQKPVVENYLAEPPLYFMSPVEVPDDQVLVLGDNRNNSDDSHLWEQKTQSVSHIVGRVRFIYYPYDRAGSLQKTALP